jgi:transcriptional regulator with XRE-family HTH domain
MMNTEADRLATARRLKAIMAFIGAETVEQFADMLEASRSQVSNWLQGYNFPKVVEMSKLCKDLMKGDMTLDYIYRGEQRGVPYGVVVHLNAILETIPLPATVPEPAETVAVANVAPTKRSPALRVVGSEGRRAGGRPAKAAR